MINPLDRPFDSGLDETHPDSPHCLTILSSLCWYGQIWVAPLRRRVALAAARDCAVRESGTTRI